MRILFIGSTQRGFRVLEALHNSQHKLVGIVSLEQDTHEMLNFESQFDDFATQHQIPLLKSRKINSEVRDFAKGLNSEIGIVVGCRVLIPKTVYEIPKRGTVAVHDSLLPHYRGFAPLNWALINGEKETGVSLFYLDEGMDTGAIAIQKKVAISDRETAPNLYLKICDATVTAVKEWLENLSQNKETRITQDNTQATYTCARIPEDGKIDWNTDAKEIDRLIRALTPPYPGAFTYLEGKKIYVTEAYPTQDRKCVGSVTGRPLSRNLADGSVDVICGNGILRITKAATDLNEPQPAAKIIRKLKTTLGA